MNVEAARREGGRLPLYCSSAGAAVAARNTLAFVHRGTHRLNNRFDGALIPLNVVQRLIVALGWFCIQLSRMRRVLFVTLADGRYGPVA